VSLPALAGGMACCAALVACGNDPPPEPDSSQAPAPVSAPTTASTASSCAGLATGLTGQVDDRGAAAATGTTLAVSAGDSFFAPTCATAVPHRSVTVKISNDGSALHNFSVTAQGIDTDVSPGQSITVTVAIGTAPLQYFCKYHKSSGMQGAFLPASP